MIAILMILSLIPHGDRVQEKPWTLGYFAQLDAAYAAENGYKPLSPGCCPECRGRGDHIISGPCPHPKCDRGRIDGKPRDCDFELESFGGGA